jgi:membrane-associated phospholipid phosphatase
VKALAALRSSEWLLVVYFGYVAILSRVFPVPTDIGWPPVAIALLVPVLFAALAHGESFSPAIFSITRDWVPAGLTLVAYREMNWFTPLVRDYHLELKWIEWDRWLLYGAGMQRAIEALGAVLPAYLELCYVLVYAVGPFAVAVMYVERQRESANEVLFVYLLGTLLSYALFPYFPSDPPRTVFGASDLPNVITPLRRFNLWIVNHYGIHSSVFPSAHVSSAFSAAWGLLMFLPSKRRYGWGMLIYAVSVSVATVYGRYHYAVDAVAGAGVSLIAGLTTLFALLRRRLRARGLP